MANQNILQQILGQSQQQISIIPIAPILVQADQVAEIDILTLPAMQEVITTILSVWARNDNVYTLEVRNLQTQQTCRWPPNTMGWQQLAFKGNFRFSMKFPAFIANFSPSLGVFVPMAFSSALIPQNVVPASARQTLQSFRTMVPQNAAAVPLCASNGDKKATRITNKPAGADTLYLSLTGVGGGLSATDFDIELAPNEEINLEGFGGTVFGLWSAGGAGFAAVSELY